MKNVKRFFCLLTLAMLSLTLLAGCGSSDSESRDADVIDVYGGTIERNGEQINIWVCHDQETVYIYYDDEERKLLDKAELPTHELHDTDWEILWVDPSDFTGDNNGDLRVTLCHADMSESYIVWAWEKDKGYVYQPDDSRFYDPGVTDDADALPVKVEGRWYCPTVDPYQYIEFDAKGNWKLYFDECNVADSGHLRYVPEEDVIYICSDVGGAMDGSYYIEVEGETLYISAGYLFSYDRFAPYEGLWLCESTDQCDYLVFDDNGNWQLQLEGKVIDEGYLWYAEEQGQALYICSKQGSDIDGCGIGVPEEDGRLFFSDYGYFVYIDESSIEWLDGGAGTGNGNEYYSWNAKLHQRNVSEFEGVWYYQEDFSADTYIVIDGNGNWSYYQRAPGDAEGTETDHGTFSYSKDEGSVYYADSAVYDGVSYWVMEFDDDILIWNYDYTYYRME